MNGTEIKCLTCPQRHHPHPLPFFRPSSTWSTARVTFSSIAPSADGFGNTRAISLSAFQKDFHGPKREKQRNLPVLLRFHHLRASLNPPRTTRIKQYHWLVSRKRNIGTRTSAWRRGNAICGVLLKAYSSIKLFLAPFVFSLEAFLHDDWKQKSLILWCCLTISFIVFIGLLAVYHAKACPLKWETTDFLKRNRTLYGDSGIPASGCILHNSLPLHWFPACSFLVVQ